MTSFLGASMQNQVSFESTWHRKDDESYRESIAQLHRTRWAKNRISGPKIENRPWKPETHFQIKNNAHFGYDRTQWIRKIRSLSRNRKSFIFCCIVLLDDNTAAHVSVSPPLATGTRAARDALSRSGDLGDLKSPHPETGITPPADSTLPRVS